MRILSFLFAISLLAACKTKQPLVQSPEDVVITENRQLDTMVISAPRVDEPDEIKSAETYELPDYNPSHQRVNDLLHTRLDLRFNWEEEQVIGKASLRFKPFFYPTDSLLIDAKNFDIDEIKLAGSNDTLAYSYDGRKINIQLDRTYQRDESYIVDIDYTANPAETGGSFAITSDKGLFFIKPDENDPDKPMQIWTQGETEWNSRWFPTIDHPNERTTQEIYLTVEQRFVTLSNGLLISSDNNEDGTRTDYWKMDLPHAPYLFMIAIGEYAIVKDEWEGKPVEYYVEPEYEEDARAIFSNTLNMLTFFSEKLGISYPWPKYSQVVVRDYVSGAMENTTSVIYGEFVQRKKRELIDDNNERIIAHELFHHWFGDLVTCESWANLTMNEGFANYAEYLWFEHQYGRDEADYHLLNEWSEYLASAQNNIHPLIHFGYDNNEDMFDAHSYNKGGAVLHMLRDYVGEEAFFAALNLYLTEHQYNSVEAHDLRLAFEAVTGDDLNWFFNQWYFSAGHPALTITYDYDEQNKMASVTVEQTQDPETSPPIFQLPVAVDIYLDEAEVLRKNIKVNDRLQTFEFPVKKKPELIQFDAERMLLAEIEDNKTDQEYLFQLYHAPKFMDRYEAIQALAASEEVEVSSLAADALEDDFWVIRGISVRLIDPEEVAEETLKKVRNLAANDPNSYVRTLALDMLTEANDEGATTTAIQTVSRDSAYHVIASGLYLLFNIDPDTAVHFAEQYQDEKNPQVLEVVEIILGESGNPEYLPFYQNRLEEFDGMGALSFFNHYQQLAAAAGPEKAMEVMSRMNEIGQNMNQSQWRRVAATKAIHDMRERFRTQFEEAEEGSEQAGQLGAFVDKLSNMIAEIKAAETDEEIQSIYKQLQID